MITFDDFKKVEIKLGKILSAEKIPDTDKLVKLSVDLGEENPRQIISGIATYFPDPQVLVGMKTTFVTNLEPRTIKGFESNGMMLTLSSPEGEFSMLHPQNDLPQGSTGK